MSGSSDAPEPKVAQPLGFEYPGARPLTTSDGVRARRKEVVYMPTLFDRLCDDAPSERSESPDVYTASHTRLREIVLRDLALLLNTTDCSEVIDVHIYEHAAKSCVNYGVPPLAGGYLSEKKWADIERMIRTAIERFEPRLMPQTLRVRPLLKEKASSHYNMLTFEISGHILMSPYPIEFTVQSQVDLENSRIELRSR